MSARKIQLRRSYSHSSGRLGMGRAATRSKTGAECPYSQAYRPDLPAPQYPVRYPTVDAPVPARDQRRAVTVVVTQRSPGSLGRGGPGVHQVSPVS